MPQESKYDLKLIRELGRTNASITSVASALGLEGTERSCFINQINNPKTEVSKAYYGGLQEAEGDINAALQNRSLTGDVDAARLIYERNQQAEVDEMKKELFGI